MLERMWTRIMGYTPDEWPHVGEVPEVSGLPESGEEGKRRGGGKQWIMAGFNGGGMAMIFLDGEGAWREW